MLSHWSKAGPHDLDNLLWQYSDDCYYDCLWFFDFIMELTLYWDKCQQWWTAGFWSFPRGFIYLCWTPVGVKHPIYGSFILSSIFKHLFIITIRGACLVAIAIISYSGMLLCLRVALGKRRKTGNHDLVFSQTSSLCNRLFLSGFKASPKGMTIFCHCSLRVELY